METAIPARSAGAGHRAKRDFFVVEILVLTYRVFLIGKALHNAQMFGNLYDDDEPYLA